MLARAVGDSLANEMKSLLDLMLAVGLRSELVFNVCSGLFILMVTVHSPALTSALKTLAVDIPSLKRDIQGEFLLRLAFVGLKCEVFLFAVL